jgi:integrase
MLNMARTKKGTPPAYRRHSSGQAVVTVRDQTGRRHDILLGSWDSPQSHEEYSRVLNLLAVNHGFYPIQNAAADSLSVNEVVVAFMREATRRYGEKGKELAQFCLSFRPLKALYGTHPADKFTPKCLRSVRQHMISLGWCRTTINRRVSRIKLAFSWAVEEELIPPSIAHGLREVKGIRKGDKSVREPEAVEPAFEDDVKKVLPFCTRPVAAMLELQWLCGMRSGEVRIMRTCDIDRTNPACWLYRPYTHKNAWRGQERLVPLGPRCVEIVTPFLRDDEPEEFLFQPCRAMEEHNRLRREKRESKKTPSQLARKPKKDAKRRPRTCYSELSYPQAVRRACDKAGVRFHPYMLRHGRKMAIEREAGSDAARCVLGQRSIQATTHYGKLDTDRAQEIMQKIG